MIDSSDIKLDELDRLLNDPEVPMEAARVWELLAELAAGSSPHDALAGAPSHHR